MYNVQEDFMNSIEWDNGSPDQVITLNLLLDSVEERNVM